MENVQMNNKIQSLAESLEPQLIQLRRQIHANPELGFEENKTSEAIVTILKKEGIEVLTGMAKTGVVALIKGKYPGKTVMLRGDMDALLIEEQNDVVYKSNNPGKMHACGHDAHISWTLGAALILNKLKEEFSGQVKVVFQPAEEGLGGAGHMVEEGVLKKPKVEAVIGAHIWPELEAGQIGVKVGPLMAAPSLFEIKIIGRGGHGAEPHKSIDPIAIANQVYQSLQQLMSRRIKPTEKVALSVTKFQSGSAHNIIPETAILGGTYRTFTEEMSRFIPREMEAIVKAIVACYGGSYEFKANTYYPALVNDKKMTELVGSTAVALFGKDALVELKEPTMAGEDFSFYLKEVPGTMFFVGTNNPEKGIIYPLHSPRFDVDESVISNVSALMAASALGYLRDEA